MAPANLVWPTSASDSLWEQLLASVRCIAGARWDLFMPLDCGPLTVLEKPQAVGTPWFLRGLASSPASWCWVLHAEPPRGSGCKLELEGNLGLVYCSHPSPPGQGRGRSAAPLHPSFPRGQREDATLRSHMLKGSFGLVPGQVAAAAHAHGGAPMRAQDWRKGCI